jgi:hypothetical protein
VDTEIIANALHGLLDQSQPYAGFQMPDQVDEPSAEPDGIVLHASPRTGDDIMCLRIGYGGSEMYDIYIVRAGVRVVRAEVS